MPEPPPQDRTPPTVSSPDADQDDEATGLQLPLSASLVLTSLPKDASIALAEANENEGVPEKVTIRLLPIASAPPLKQKVFKVSASNRFETVVNFLSKKLTAAAAAAATAAATQQQQQKDGQGAEGGGSGAPGTPKAVAAEAQTQVFCYVNSVFAPGLDEGVGGLWRCFKTDDQLIVSYSITPAFG